MKIYKAEKRASLFLVRAFIKGPSGKAYLKLLIDTGSAYTLISQEILESIGCSPAFSKRTQRIITGSGYEIVPIVLVDNFNCLGQQLDNFEILAHTLPFGAYIDGLLGMDFLLKFDIEIKTSSAEIFIK